MNRDGYMVDSFVKARTLEVKPLRQFPLLPVICASCCWWKPHHPDDPEVGGFCRKNPPRVELPPFPTTKPRDTCGAFERHYTKEEWAAVKAICQESPS